MRWIAGILSLLTVSLAGASELVPNPDADAKFDEIERSIFLYDANPYTIPKAIEKNEVAGLSVVLIHDGKPAVHRTYGYRIKRKEERTTEETIYQCASTSKMVSSLGIVTAARQGKLRLDQSVAAFNDEHPDTLLTRWQERYFQGDKTTWPEEITLPRLLSHSAGLAVHPIMAAPWLPSNDPLESILFGRSIFKEAVRPLHEPGTKYDYSGGGYTVAEAWLEIATGTKFKDYLKARVLDPLGMTRSTYETGSPDTPNLAWGCSRGVCLYNVRTLDVKAAGGLLCHPVDYARLVALMLNGGKEYLPAGKGTQLIHADDVVAMLTPSRHKDTGAPIRSGGPWYGLGTNLSDYTSADGLPTRFDHGGEHQGFSIEFYAHREENAGIVVMVNGDRQWTKQREEYGGVTLGEAVLQAFKVAYGIIGAGKPLTPRCGKDVDCGAGEYCDAGIGFDKNRCVLKKEDNDACDIVGGGHQCRGGRCAYGRCYTPGSVAMGGTCYIDAACDVGKCSAVDGARGSCVCKSDTDCGTGLWCNAGLDVTGNRCLPLKANNAACDVVGGGHQCLGGQCAYGRCYTPGSVAMGGTCYIDAACDVGKCSAVDGARGSCVCKSDTDCGTGLWCNAGLDVTGNRCLPLKADNAACDVVGGGHQCRGGQCAYGRCYTANAVAMGGTCYVDAACGAGKCSAVDGTRGTCVCKDDGDCGSGNWCDAGFDAKLNACRVKLAAGESCGKVGSVGNDHKCKSGKCSGAPFYKCT